MLVTDDAHYAEAFANATWGATKDKEVEMFNELAKKKADEAEAKRKEVRTRADPRGRGKGAEVNVKMPVHMLQPQETYARRMASYVNNYPICRANKLPAHTKKCWLQASEHVRHSGALSIT